MRPDIALAVQIPNQKSKKRVPERCQKESGLNSRVVATFLKVVCCFS